MGKYSLDHLVAPESKELFKTHTHTLVGHVNGAQEPTERTPNGQSWNNLSIVQIKAASDYNQKYNINIHESILI